jgi:hypothetical protein
MSVVEGVERDLRNLPEEFAKSGLAESAIAMAREQDDYDNNATAKANCANAMRDIIRQLREEAPKPEERDKLDDLSARRAARRSTAS